MTEQIKLWDNCVKVGEIAKSDSTKLVVELVAREGVKSVRIHEWYKTKRNTAWAPSAKSMAIPITVPINGDVSPVTQKIVVLLAKAMELAETFELDVPANAVFITKKEDK